MCDSTQRRTPRPPRRPIGFGFFAPAEHRDIPSPPHTAGLGSSHPDRPAPAILTRPSKATARTRNLWDSHPAPSGSGTRSKAAACRARGNGTPQTRTPKRPTLAPPNRRLRLPSLTKCGDFSHSDHSRRSLCPRRKPYVPVF